MLTAVLVLSLFGAEPATTPSAPKPAAASDADIKKARELFQAGQKLFTAGKFADALVKFKEANTLKPHPSIVFNIAKCQESLGDDGAALRSYREYLRLAPTAGDKDTVADSVTNLEGRLREKGVQQVVFFTEPAGAKVSVDGKELGPSPVNAELTAGAHKVVATAPNFRAVEQSVAVTLAHATDVTLTLPAAASDLKAPSGDFPKDPVLVAAEPVTPTPAEPVSLAKDPAQKPRARLFTWVSAGVAVVGAGVGALFAVTYSNGVKQRSMFAPGTADFDQWTPIIAARANAANVSFGVAAVAAVAAIVLFFVEGR